MANKEYQDLVKELREYDVQLAEPHMEEGSAKKFDDKLNRLKIVKDRYLSIEKTAKIAKSNFETEGKGCGTLDHLKAMENHGKSRTMRKLAVAKLTYLAGRRLTQIAKGTTDVDEIALAIESMKAKEIQSVALTQANKRKELLEATERSPWKDVATKLNLFGENEGRALDKKNVQSAMNKDRIQNALAQHSLRTVEWIGLVTFIKNTDSKPEWKEGKWICGKCGEEGKDDCKDDCSKCDIINRFSKDEVLEDLRNFTKEQIEKFLTIRNKMVKKTDDAEERTRIDEIIDDNKEIWQTLANELLKKVAACVTSEKKETKTLRMNYANEVKLVEYDLRPEKPALNPSMMVLREKLASTTDFVSSAILNHTGYQSQAIERQEILYPADIALPSNESGLQSVITELCESLFTPFGDGLQQTHTVRGIINIIAENGATGNTRGDMTEEESYEINEILEDQKERVRIMLKDETVELGIKMTRKMTDLINSANGNKERMLARAAIDVTDNAMDQYKALQSLALEAASLKEVRDIVSKLDKFNKNLDNFCGMSSSTLGEDFPAGTLASNWNLKTEEVKAAPRINLPAQVAVPTTSSGKTTDGKSIDEDLVSKMSAEERQIEKHQRAVRDGETEEKRKEAKHMVDFHRQVKDIYEKAIHRKLSSYNEAVIAMAAAEKAHQTVAAATDEQGEKLKTQTESFQKVEFQWVTDHDDVGGGRFEFFHKQANLNTVESKSQTEVESEKQSRGAESSLSASVSKSGSALLFGLPGVSLEGEGGFKHSDSKAAEEGTGSSSTSTSRNQAVMEFEHLRATVEKSNVMKTLMNMMQLPSWYLKGYPAYYLKDLYYIDAVIVVRKFLVYVGDESTAARVETAVFKEAETSNNSMSYKAAIKSFWGDAGLAGGYSKDSEKARASTKSNSSAKVESRDNIVRRGNSVIKFLVLRKLPDAPACADPGMGMDGDMWMELH